jgi:transposase InsO family protein
MSKVMLTPEQRIRQRYAWFEAADRLGNVTVACERCGISRKTFYKWRKRFQVEQGAKTALLDRSRRPHHPHRRVKKALRRRLLTLRRRTHLGPARLRALLVAQGSQHVPSSVTIAKVLKAAGLTRRHRATTTRYRRVFVVPRPGDLVQLDVKFVPYLVDGHRLYQYTAIDCCTRLRLVTFSDELSLAAAKVFAQYVLSTLPFPVRLVQTDNDSIFTHWYTAGPKTPLDRPVKAHPFTVMCAQFGAGHRLNPPRTPRLNGKVERSHQTDDQEFYHLQREKDTGHLLGAKYLNFWMRDFNSWRFMPRIERSRRRIPRVRGWAAPCCGLGGRARRGTQIRTEGTRHLVTRSQLPALKRKSNHSNSSRAKPRE